MTFVRESLDTAALTVWLHAQATELLGESTAPITITQFPGGFSNLTYRVDTADRSMVLRRPPRGVARGAAHDMSREYRLLSALHPAGVPVPQPLAYCDDESVLGAPFYLMQLVHGVILRQSVPEGLHFDASVANRLSHAFVQRLADLHALDVSALGLSELGKPHGYVSRQVSGWTRRWEAAKTSDVTAMDEIARWLAENQPAEQGASLLHNDFKYDNLVLDPTDLTHIRAILDWEMATVGCPLMDLGTSLAYWVERDDPLLLRSLGLGVTAAAGSYTRRQLIGAYETASDRHVATPVYYYVYGLFKLAVVAQQIFARHVAGLTNDPRFAQLDQAVNVLAEIGSDAVASNRVGA